MLLPEFTFNPQTRAPKHRWREVLVRVLRVAVLSRKAPTLPTWLAWMFAGVWVAFVGLLVSTALFLLMGSQAETGFETTALVWLTAHQIPLHTSVGTISFLPLGLMLIPLLLWRRASRWLEVQNESRRPWRMRSLVSSLVLYAMIVLLVAVITRVGEVSVRPLPALIASLMVASLGIWLGVRRQNPSRVRPVRTFAGGSVALWWFLAIGSLVLVVAVVAGFAEMNAVRETLATETVGVIGVISLELMYLPNLIGWAAAYATGSGVYVGGDQVVSPFTTGPVLLPDLPVLAALPEDQPSWTAMLPILVVIGGWMAAVVAQRRVPIRGLRARLLRAGSLAAFTFVVWVPVAYLAGGSLGEGRLDQLGPVASTPFVAAALIGLGALAWALIPTLASDARPVAKDLRERIDRGSPREWIAGVKPFRSESGGAVGQDNQDKESVRS